MSFVDSILPAVTDAAENIIGDILAPYVTIAIAGRSIGGIIPDVSVREVLVDQDVLTAHPVETGAPIVDHVYREPYQIEMTMGWSDSSFGGYAGRVLDVYQTLLALRATQEPFDVTTGKRAYQNMMFREIVVTTDENTEWALMVTARLQEVIISQTDQGTAGTTNTNQADPQQTGPETNVGQQSAGPLPFFASDAPQAQPSSIGSGASGSLPFFATGTAPTFN